MISIWQLFSLIITYHWIIVWHSPLVLWNLTTIIQSNFNLELCYDSVQRLYFFIGFCFHLWQESELSKNAYSWSIGPLCSMVCLFRIKNKIKWTPPICHKQISQKGFFSTKNILKLRYLWQIYWCFLAFGSFKLMFKFNFTIVS